MTVVVRCHQGGPGSDRDRSHFRTGDLLRVDPAAGQVEILSRDA
jgi:ferredoxin-NADP reductase